MAIDHIRAPDTIDGVTIAMDGVSVHVPPRWEARISRANHDIADGARNLPVVHASTIALPAARGDYGSNVVEKLGPSDVFVSLVEFDGESAESPLFRSTVVFPTHIAPEHFRPDQLQRTLPGQAGKQVFFTLKGRPFCLYVVLGSFALREPLSTKVDEILQSFSIETR